ncbi:MULTISPECIES: hypothetical protein [unclassified Microcoleus]|uniref:hypothetical protein n=1 Tax=unclassified Microcoleus TaxID=2642155 RepID=UPI002FD24205
MALIIKFGYTLTILLRASAIIAHARSTVKPNATIDPAIHLTRSRLTHKLCM